MIKRLLGPAGEPKRWNRQFRLGMVKPLVRLRSIKPMSLFPKGKA